MNEPTNREILDALLQFKEAAELRFNHVDARFERIEHDINRRFDRVDDRFDRVDADIAEVRRELRGKRKRG